MKPTQSILILLSLFLMFSCEDNSVEPLVCDEGLTYVDGGCVFVCEEGITECYYQGDLDVLQDIIDTNESLSGEEPIEIGSQKWIDGKLNTFELIGKTQKNSLALDGEFNIELSELNELNSSWFRNYFI